MYCIKCGSKISDGSSFCSLCGTPIDAQQSETSLDTKDKFSYKSSLNKWSGVWGICFVIANGLWVSNSGVAAALFSISIVPAVITCYYWAKSKGRHPASAAWGILAPIGFLGVALLKDKWKDEVEQPRVSQEMVDTTAKPSSGNVDISSNVEPTLSVRSVSLQESGQQNVLTCAKCGSFVSINDMFCTKCGTRQVPAEKSEKYGEEPKSEKSPEYIEQLQTLAQLRDDGVLTQQEFEEKKAKILRDSA